MGSFLWSRSRTPQGYVANGSCYQIALCYTTDETRKPTSGGFTYESSVFGHTVTVGVRSAANAPEMHHTTIGIGKVVKIPVSAKHIKVILLNAKEEHEIHSEGGINENKIHDWSVIIAKDGSVQYGDKSLSGPNEDWMWISHTDGRNHRPKNFFVANASGKKLKVQHVQRDGTLAGDQYVLINNGCSIDLDYYSVKIEDADGSQNPQVYFQNKVDPRVSIIVCPDGNVRYSKQLLGEDVEREKWRVDGKSYKPLDVKEFCSGICDTIRNGFARCKRFFLRVWSKIKNCSKSRVTCCSRN